MHDDRTLALIDADRRRLVRAAARLLGPTEAEDVVQDAYVRALEANTQPLDAAQAWLLTVVRNLAVDQLRRRRWMDQWLSEASASPTEPASASAEADAALAEEAARALRLLAARLAPADGAAVLLHEVFEASHAEIAQAAGRSEAASRQQLRRALLRLRQPGDTPPHRSRSEPDPHEEGVYALYLHALQWRDPQALWAALRQPMVLAASGMASAADAAGAAPHASHCGVIQVGGRLGLALTLDGVRLCVLPLGVQAQRDMEAAVL